MTDFIILGTDTDAGKTTFALLWLAVFAEYEYWKPVETGASDTRRIGECLPNRITHAPVVQLAHPVAPPLAARLENGRVPDAASIGAARPVPSRPDAPLLVETFGSPFSPLNNHELQIELIRRLDLPTVLVSSATLGVIGRTLQCVEAL